MKGITCTQTSLHLTRNVNVINYKKSYDFNDEVTMTCNTGFCGKTVTSRCTDVDTWSANQPTCTCQIFHSKHLKVDRKCSSNTALPRIIGKLKITK